MPDDADGTSPTSQQPQQQISPQSHYQTRSRSSATAPFSPPRTAITHLGHTYHVTNPEYDMQRRQEQQQQPSSNSDEPPVIHIVERTGSQDSNASVVDVDYANFIEELQAGPSGVQAKQVDSRRTDPDFYLKRNAYQENADVDDYSKRVPCELIFFGVFLVLVSFRERK